MICIVAKASTSTSRYLWLNLFARLKTEDNVLPILMDYDYSGLAL